MLRPYRNNVLMLNLTAASLVCLLFLLGLFIYKSGNLLPSTKGADAGEAAQMWIIWSVAVALPLMTGVLWVFRLTKRGGD